MRYLVQTSDESASFKNEEDALKFAEASLTTGTLWAVVTRESADGWQSVIKVF